MSIPVPTVKLVRKWFVLGFLLRFLQNSSNTLKWLSYDINSTYAGKPWPWRIRRWVKLYFPTLWGRHGGFWSRCMAQNLRSQQITRFEILGHPATSKPAMSAPKCRKMKFDPPLDAPESRLSSARRINIVWQTLECITSMLSKLEWKSKNEPGLANLTEGKGMWKFPQKLTSSSASAFLKRVSYNKTSIPWSWLNLFRNFASLINRDPAMQSIITQNRWDFSFWRSCIVGTQPTVLSFP